MTLQTFIEAWLNTWTGNKPQELLRFYAEGVYYSDPANPRGITNKQDLNLYFTKLLATNPYWIWKAEEIMPTEKGCTLKWKAKIPVQKETIVINGLDILEISNWKIIRNEVYFDPTLWKEAIQRQNGM